MNMRNRAIRIGCSANMLGVTKRQDGNWAASGSENGRLIALGVYKTKREARLIAANWRQKRGFTARHCGIKRAKINGIVSIPTRTYKYKTATTIEE